jgi:hypothetical protein
LKLRIARDLPAPPELTPELLARIREESAVAEAPDGYERSTVFESISCESSCT